MQIQRSLRTRPYWAASRALVALLAPAALLSCKKDGPTGPGATVFSLEIRFLETAPTGATRTSFENAFTIVRETITAPLSPVGIPGSFTDLEACGADYAGQPAITSETIQGLLVYIIVAPVDGTGGVLASAGPCLVRSAAQNSLTALGVMRFDAADVAVLQSNGRLTVVVLHELLHVLGFGTIWTDNDLLSGDSTGDARFLGPRARTACANVHAGGAACATDVPVHSADGTGSAYAHWRESLFTSELMTPFLTAGSTPFSLMTVESLGDLGYTVSGVHTNAFTVSGTLLRMEGESNEEPLVRFPEPQRPVFTIDESGALVPYRRSR